MATKDEGIYLEVYMKEGDFIELMPGIFIDEIKKNTADVAEISPNQRRTFRYHKNRCGEFAGVLENIDKNSMVMLAPMYSCNDSKIQRDMLISIKHVCRALDVIGTKWLHLSNDIIDVRKAFNDSIFMVNGSHRFLFETISTSCAGLSFCVNGKKFSELMISNKINLYRLMLPKL